MRHTFTAILLISLIVGFSHASFASTPSQLKRLNHKIESIKALLSKAQSKRSHYEKALAKTEIASGKLLMALKKTKRHLNQQHMLLSHLSRKVANSTTQLNSQEAHFARQIRAAYLLGRQPYLKLMLSQSDAAHIGRILVYYRYFSANQIAAIHTLETTLTQLQRSQEEIQSQTSVLKTLQKNQRQDHEQLQKTLQARKKIINNINRTIHTKKQRLHELLANKALLEHTIEQLDHEKQTQMAMKQNFATLKGTLNWPTKGKILSYFGTQIDQSQIKWGGILIHAPEDQPIHAIANGKVIFSRWLPGYGLLLIINHGHGYMTLYGRNHYLYKKLGDTVEKGELIATVGNSGGYEKPALYFAIRHNGKPLNPVSWCRNKA